MGPWVLPLPRTSSKTFLKALPKGPGHLSIDHNQHTCVYAGSNMYCACPSSPVSSTSSCMDSCTHRLMQRHIISTGSTCPQVLFQTRLTPRSKPLPMGVVVPPHIIADFFLKALPRGQATYRSITTSGPGLARCATPRAGRMHCSEQSASHEPITIDRSQADPAARTTEQETHKLLRAVCSPQLVRQTCSCR
jgi:hypothetical protein